jgi:hypothetical protein
MKTEYFIGVDLGSGRILRRFGDGGAACGSESCDVGSISSAVYAAAAVGVVVSVRVDCAAGGGPDPENGAAVCR